MSEKRATWYGNFGYKNETLDNVFLNNNRAYASGSIEEELKYSYEAHGEQFYTTRVIVKRQSGINDFVPIIVSRTVINRDFKKRLTGRSVKVYGQLRTYKRISQDGLKHLQLFLFVTSIKCIEEENCETENNQIYLEGSIRKEPVFRITPVSKKPITDILLEVHRDNGKSDFIPCIAWGSLAYKASDLEIGSKIAVYGRLQSRNYSKIVSEESGKIENKTTYEVTIMQMGESK